MGQSRSRCQLVGRKSLVWPRSGAAAELLDRRLAASGHVQAAGTRPWEIAQRILQRATAAGVVAADVQLVHMRPILSGARELIGPRPYGAYVDRCLAVVLRGLRLDR